MYSHSSIAANAMASYSLINHDMKIVIADS